MANLGVLGRDNDVYGGQRGYCLGRWFCEHPLKEFHRARPNSLQIDDNSPRRFGDSVSGWWLLVNRWNPFSNARNVPAITEIQSRLA